jgi:hypothetical protein
MSCCTSPSPKTTLMTDDVMSQIKIMDNVNLNEVRVAMHYRGRQLQAGFHITEIKHATIQSLDCAAGRDAWDEVVIQLLDVEGPEEGRMSARKFISILGRSGVDLSNANRSTVVLEVGRPDEAMQIFELVGIHEANGMAHLTTQPRQAVCKPSLRALDLTQTSPSGSCATATSSCCA